LFAVSDFCHLASFLELLPLQKAVLVPCSDLWSIACAGLPNHVKERFYTSLSGLEVQKNFVDALARILELKGGRYDCAHACVGGGQGVATTIEREAYGW